MHTQDQYPLEHSEVRRLIAEHGWAQIVTAGPHGPRVTYGFFLLEDSQDGELTVLGHFARADPQAADIQARAPTLLVFDGPNGYISASWYAPQITHVPSTWNHISAHLHGTPEPLSGEPSFDVLARTLARQEALETEPWQLTEDNLRFARQIAPATIVFRLRATRIEAKAKLSQNKPAGVRERIVEQLERPGPHMNRRLAAEMRRLVLGSDTQH